MTFYRFAETSKTGRNSRIDSLFNLLGLQNRLYTGDIFAINNQIDYMNVEKQLEHLRKTSLDFLENSLKDNA